MTTGELLTLLGGGIMAILGWLVSTKVNRIDSDLEKFDSQLQMRKDKQIELELLIAKEHPTKDDIKSMMIEFRSYLDERFNHIEQIAKGYSSDATGKHKSIGGN